MQVDENCKNRYVDFIKEFRQRYNKLPESTRSFVWNVDDFNSPCQIISFVVHTNKDLTYLWVRKDPEFQDLDIKCYGRIIPQNFLETACRLREFIIPLAEFFDKIHISIFAVFIDLYVHILLHGINP